MASAGGKIKLELAMNRGYDDDDDDIIGQEGKWKDLLPELLETIFEKVVLTDKILSLHFVCKSWHKAVRSPQSWKSLNFQPLANDPDRYNFFVRFRLTYHIDDHYFFSRLLKLLASLGGAAVQELLFSEADIFTPDALAYAAKKCPEVKTLALPRLTDPRRFPSIISEWKSLERLHIVTIPFTFVEVMQRLGANCKNLVELRTSGLIRSREVAAIVGFLPKIRRLYFDDYYFDNCVPKDLLLMVHEGCKELQFLKFYPGKGSGIIQPPYIPK